MELRKTKDDSLTLKHPTLGVHYHSVHGAWSETQHVFGQEGLRPLAEAWSGGDVPIRVLEVGMGTGLNVLCALSIASATGASVQMDSLEPHPLAWDEVKSLGYDALTGVEREVWQQIHEQGGLEFDSFSFRRVEKELLHADLPERHYDVVFFDAFAPTAEPHMWTVGVMDVMRHCLKPGGWLVTYCAQGDARRAMLSAGFAVERRPGPPGKREMLKAVRSHHPQGKINVRVYMVVIREGLSGPEVLVSYERLPKLGGVMKFPGGGLEWGEGPAACLRREALEELGQPVAIDRLCHISEQAYVSSFDDTHQVMAVHYSARLLDEPRFDDEGVLEDVFGKRVPLMHQALGWRPVAGLEPSEFFFGSDREAWAAWLAQMAQ